MHPYGWWFPIPWLFVTVLFVFLLVRFVLFRGGCGWNRWDRPLDAESILKRRLAGGQITEEEFHRLRHILKESTL